MRPFVEVAVTPYEVSYNDADLRELASFLKESSIEA